MSKSEISHPRLGAESTPQKTILHMGAAYLLPSQCSYLITQDRASKSGFFFTLLYHSPKLVTQDLMHLIVLQTWVATGVAI